MPKFGGTLIVIDGIDGCGKTTQVHLLVHRLLAEGHPCISSREPTSGPWGEKLRRSAHDGRLAPLEEVNTILNDRRDDVERCILPALHNKLIVVLDRYYTSTIAYQSLRGFDTTYILDLNERFAPVPDIIFLLEVPYTIGLDRIRLRGDKPDHFEDAEQLRQIATNFKCMKLPGLVRLDGTFPLELVHNEIYRIVAQYIRTGCVDGATT